MKFLLTNDDGIDAPGLAALEQAVVDLGELVVVAPTEHLSGCSHQTTTDRPLQVDLRGPARYALDGTPADCTRLGLHHLAADADWVLAGINDGGNLGCDVFMSGTVAAVREAALLGKPGLAVSHYRRRNAQIDWPLAARWTRFAIEQLLALPVPVGAFWNVNLPHRETGSSELPELMHCPVDPHPLAFHFEEHNGAWHYRGNYQARQRQPDHDVYYCFAGAITASCLSARHEQPAPHRGRESSD